jgi:hypothetical protein
MAYLRALRASLLKAMFVNASFLFNNKVWKRKYQPPFLQLLAFLPIMQ